MRKTITALAIALVVALLTIGGAAALGVEAPIPVAVVVGVVAAAAYLARTSGRPASGGQREDDDAGS